MADGCFLWGITHNVPLPVKGVVGSWYSSGHKQIVVYDNSITLRALDFQDDSDPSYSFPFSLSRSDHLPVPLRG